MGMESYFFHLLPEGVAPVRPDVPGGNNWRGASSVPAPTVRDAIQTTMANLHLAVQPSERFSNELVVDEAVEVMIDDEGGLFQKATLMGCFAWYDEGLKLCYQIARAVDRCVRVEVCDPWLRRAPLEDEQAFVERIKGVHRDKHQEFLRVYGDVRGKARPNQYFSALCRRSRSPCWRCWRTLRTTWKG